MNATLIVNVLLEASPSPERVAQLSKQFSLPETEIIELAAHDPTNGKYLTWIIKQIKAGSLRFPEDGEKVQQRLLQFYQLSKKPNFQGETDILKYATYGDLAKVVDANSDVKTKGEVVRTAEMNGCRLLSTLGDDKLYIVTTPEAAAKLFRHTEWCVKDPEWFARYNPKEFYFVTRNDKPFALYHGGYDATDIQFKDVHDNDMEERLPILEPYIMKDPAAASYYARKIIGDYWPEAEASIATNYRAAYYYARDIVKNSWPAGEAAIATEPVWAYHYAAYVVDKRWPAGEPAIATDPKMAYKYATNVVEGSWPEGEAAIAQDPICAYNYAHDVLKKRSFPAGETAIATDPETAYKYARHIIKKRWPKGEAAIAKHSEWAYLYAKHVVKKPWPEGEPAIAKNYENAEKYNLLFGTDLSDE